MSENPKYRVLPKEVDPKPIPQVDSVPLSDWEKRDIKGLSGCAGFFLATAVFGGVLAWGISARMEGGSAAVLAAVAGAVVVAVIHFSIIGTKTSDKERAKAQQEKQNVDSANKTAISQAENEARYVTTSLMTTFESSEVITSEFPQCLSKAANSLQRAEQEYKDNAFSPFWDAVENAAQQLAVFNDKAKQISRFADQYYGGLNGRRHTFPSFPVNSSNLANPSSVINELRRVVRMGQTNFQFANIWEHRRTREVMTAGFRTLGEAVSNLGSTVENAVYGLQQSISTDTARLVQEEIKTWDSLDSLLMEQNRMLDNIQHHRKPGITDSPSRY